MSYWILVFNPQPIDEINPEELSAALTRSNFHTLCKQYELNAAMIEPALENLSVKIAPEAAALAFLLNYQSETEPSIPVYCWPARSEKGTELLAKALAAADSIAVFGLLHRCSQIIGIELSSVQLQDMGLLLGYEIARWAADSGGGLVRGLDGIWYRLNRHLAFLTLEEPIH